MPNTVAYHSHHIIDISDPFHGISVLNVDWASPIVACRYIAEFVMLCKRA